MLFKILQGNSSRISTSTTPFHDGWAYFTSNDGGFYIDATVDGTQKRIQVNARKGNITTMATTEPTDQAANDTWLKVLSVE